MTQVLAVEPVLPEYRYSQAELTDALVPLIGGGTATERTLRRIHGGCEVDFRHLALPLEEYSQLTDFGRSNDAFITAAVELGAAALTSALDQAGLPPHEVDFIISVTITGLAVPSLEADRKSTRLNSSHVAISYAVFCLKREKRDRREQRVRG